VAKVYPAQKPVGWYLVHTDAMSPAHVDALSAQLRPRLDAPALVLHFVPGSAATPPQMQLTRDGAVLPFRLEGTDLEQAVMAAVFMERAKGGGVGGGAVEGRGGGGGGAASGGGGGGGGEGVHAPPESPPPPSSPATASLETTLAALLELQSRVSSLQAFVARCSAAAAAGALPAGGPTAAALRRVTTLLNRLPLGEPGAVARAVESEGCDALLAATGAAAACGAAGLLGLAEKVAALGGVSLRAGRGGPGADDAMDLGLIGMSMGGTRAYRRVGYSGGNA
jgi:hypothetical protein